MSELTTVLGKGRPRTQILGRGDLEPRSGSNFYSVVAVKKISSQFLFGDCTLTTAKQCLRAFADLMLQQQPATHATGNCFKPENMSTFTKGPGDSTIPLGCGKGGAESLRPWGIAVPTNLAGKGKEHNLHMH